MRGKRFRVGKMAENKCKIVLNGVQWGMMNTVYKAKSLILCGFARNKLKYCEQPKSTCIVSGVVLLSFL